MDFENFARLHPIGYVHLAYAVVWGLQFGYVLWIAGKWRKSSSPPRE